MHEIVVISGKGGTGKTSLTAAFAHLASNHIICDLDVDAPDLHLLLDPAIETEEDFVSGHHAVVNPETCTACGLCLDFCRFQAVKIDGPAATVDPLLCEGCMVCVHFCPAQAIDFPENHAGRFYLSRTRFGPMVHARLFPGQENSGRLVDLLRRRAKALAREQGKSLILCDGAPGLGCPVISSLSGVDLAVAVTEPTPSGAHDLARIVELCRHFRVGVGVIVNKYDLNLEQTGRIEEYCRLQGLPVFARLPHDVAMTQAMVQRRTITEFRNGGLSESVRQAWSNIENSAFCGDKKHQSAARRK